MFIDIFRRVVMRRWGGACFSGALMLMTLAATLPAQTLVGHWALDETSGTTAADATASANDGTLYNGGASCWIDGQDGGALDLSEDSDYVLVGHDSAIDFSTGSFTVMFWLKQDTSVSDVCWLVKGTNGNEFTGASGCRYEFYHHADGYIRFTLDDASTKSEISISDSSAFVTGDWVHVAGVRDSSAGMLYLYADGVLAGSETDGTSDISESEDLYFGRMYDGGRMFTGALDDIRIYDDAMNQTEIQAVMAEAMTVASDPSPADGATGVATDPELTWTPGSLAATHAVYFGTDEGAVDSATTASTEYMGEISEAGYSPGTLAESTAYYWRVDEINASETDSPWAGAVWSFTTAEPLGTPSNPFPADAETAAGVNSSLSWDAVTDAAMYDVYFGTSDPPEWQGVVTNNEFRLETLGRGQTYYWQIVARNDTGRGEGPVWSFTAETSATDGEIYQWPVWIADTIFDDYPAITDWDDWNYEEGLMLGEIYRLAKTLETKDGWATESQEWIDYIQDWLDQSVASDGKVSNFTMSDYNLDMISSAKLIVMIYNETGDSKYYDAADYMIGQLEDQPKTSDGGYWHKKKYYYQMWLDGLYMAEPFSVMYGELYNDTGWYDEALYQIKLARQHTLDSTTGLMRHGWYDLSAPELSGTDKTPTWADAATGQSPEVWGRAMGWYGVAMVDVLDTIPDDYSSIIDDSGDNSALGSDYTGTWATGSVDVSRAETISILQAYCASLLPYQDEETGMWYQVVDKGDQSDNWVESSCTAMFAYTMAKGVNEGYLDASYMDVAKRAFRGLLNNRVTLTTQTGFTNVDLDGTVNVGSLSGDGDYDYYVTITSSVYTRENDKKGVGPFLGLARQLAIYNEQFVPVEMSGFEIE